MEQVAERPRVLPGYRFNPSPEELIVSYLSPWVSGQPLGELAGVVCAADVYSCDPATLTERFWEYGHDGTWYFLCVARWKAARGAAPPRGRTAVMSRVVEGGGYWHCSQRKAVVGVGRLAGRQSFEYRDASDRKTKWLMEEFSSDMEEAADDNGVKVICKVYLSPRAPPQTALVKEELREAKVIAGSKRSAPHLENAGSVAPPPVKEERHETKLAGSKRSALHRENVGSVAPPPATVKEESQETKVITGFKRPVLLYRQNVGESVAPAPAKMYGAAEAGCSYAAGTSQAAPTAAWMHPKLERMTRPACYHGGVFIKMELEQEPLVMVSANGEVGQFAQTTADGARITIDARKEETAANEWADRVLNPN